MYRVGNRKRNHRKATIVASSIVLFLILIALSGVTFAKQFLKPQTNIKQSSAVTTTVTASLPATKVFSEGIFTIQLPADWKLMPGELKPYDITRFEVLSDDANDQELDVYQDTIPLNFAVNRVLPISADGNSIMTNGAISDNCANFTKNQSGVVDSNGTPAKWSGVNFLCDLNNNERDVIGTSSTEGVNLVHLTGTIAGAHTYFFTYTDNSIDPDFTTFYNALTSFHLK
jgi:hypothetical protein